MALKWIDLMDTSGRASSLEISEHATIRVTGGLEHNSKIFPKTVQDANNLIAWLERWRNQQQKRQQF
jgi:hypothetical protein